jgi:hypothetical protein
MPKDDGTRTLSQSGGNGNGTAERLVCSPPGLLLADIIRGRREAAQKRCCLATMSTNDDGANDDGWFQMNIPSLINKQRNASFRQTYAMRVQAF